MIRARNIPPGYHAHRRNRLPSRKSGLSDGPGA